MTLDAAGKNVDVKLSEKDKEIAYLKQEMAKMENRQKEMEKMIHTIGEKAEVKVIRARGRKS